MKRPRARAYPFAWLVVIGVLLSACSGAATPTATALPPTAPPTAVPPTIAPPTTAPTDTAAPTKAPTVAATATQAPTTAPTDTAVPTTAPTVAPTAGPTHTPGPQELTVLDWSGYDQAVFWKDFAAKHPKVQPQYSFFAEDGEAFTKAASGFPFDLVHPCSSWWKLYVDKGLVQPIDTSQLSNWPGLRPELAALGQFDGKQYFVPWEWGFESILVRTDKVKTVPQSWADLWNPEYKGHLSLYDSGESSHAMTALALGIDPWKATADQEAQIKAKLIALKPNVLDFWTDSTTLGPEIASGDVWVAANAWPDAYKTAVDAGLQVQYLEPKEGRLSWVCGYGLSSKVKNIDLAYDYINAMISPASMAEESNQYAYGASNVQAIPLTDPALVKLMHLDDPAILQNGTVFYQSLTEKQRRDLTSMWTDVKAAP
jgi:spermidine/putrescine transport system substrate-binding protein